MVGIFFKHFWKQYRYYIVILLGVIAGALLANTVIDNITDKIGIFNSEFKNAFLNVNLDGTLYLRYILKLRLKEYLCLLLVIFTPVAIAGIYFLVFFVGVSCGLMISVCVMNMGIRGVLIYAVCLIPQYLIYAIAVSFIISYIEKRQFDMKKTATVIIISLVFIILGTLYETYISPWMIKGLFEHISNCI